MRGLKLLYVFTPGVVAPVAPLAGAWIETSLVYIIDSGKDKSHPSRVRGLKPAGVYVFDFASLSHPSRVRGLKLLQPAGIAFEYSSHPSRVRGLKQWLYPLENSLFRVAPLAGAWIETLTPFHLLF